MNRHSRARRLISLDHWNQWNRFGPWRILAVILAAPAFVFADNIPGHSTGANKYVTFSEGFTSQQNSKGGSAECNFLLGAPRENGLSTSSIAGSSSNAVGASGDPVKFVDFSGNNGASPDTDNGKGKGKGKGKQSGGSGGGNGTAAGNGGSAPLVAVPEPASQTLLLVGLAGLGMGFFRRRTPAIAI